MSNTLNGFIKLHRKLVAWGWYQDYVVKDVFLHILLTASFRDTSWQGTILKQGQLVTSYKNLAESLGFSVRQVRTALSKLKSTGELTIEATNRYSIITVVNWEEYQLCDEAGTSKKTQNKSVERQTSDKQATNKRQHRNNVKNVNNVKNNINAPAQKENEQGYDALSGKYF